MPIGWPARALVAGDDVTAVCDWQEERLRRGDDLRLQMAIEESRMEKAKPEEVCLVTCVYASHRGGMDGGYTHSLDNTTQFLFLSPGVTCCSCLSPVHSVEKSES